MNGVIPDEQIGQVLDFWFDGDPAECDDPQALMRKWFSGTPDQDRELEENFGSLAKAAARGELDAWTTTPAGRLALIILLDQLPRSLYRGTPDAFASDPKALSITLQGLDQGQDNSLHALERIFFCMPLQHAESREVQSRSCKVFDALADSVTADPLASVLRSASDYAHEHCRIVDRFGRFPHRNQTLGRESSEAELEFLNSGGPTYGQ
ncbi:MAG TPA: DUF924 family protein [Gammaproteobacteria bacterium]